MSAFKREMNEFLGGALEMDLKNLQVFGVSEGSICLNVLIKDLNDRAKMQLQERCHLQNKGLSASQVSVVYAEFLLKGFNFNQIRVKYSWT
mmetsp:Transcript_3348/g.3319  ORF Transcript_3348/g.3319 Transcript_3348/m.3319 type:complete len:91 (+) Transcript_3348:1-273(+)